MGIEWLSPVSISVSRAPLFAKGWHSMSLRGQFCQIWWQPLRRLMTYRGKEWNCKDGPDGVVTEPRIRLALLWPNRPPYNRLNTQYPDHILDLPTYSSRAMIVWLLKITAGLYAAVSVYVEINREGSKVRGSHYCPPWDYVMDPPTTIRQRTHIKVFRGHLTAGGRARFHAN